MGDIQRAESREHRNPRPLSRLRSVLRQSILGRRSTPHAIRLEIRFLKPHKQIPRFASALLGALQFTASDSAAWGSPALVSLDEGDWKKVLAFSDRHHLTLALGTACLDQLPSDVRRRLESNLANNAERWNRTRDTYREIAAAFDLEGIEYGVLKGFTHCPLFVSDPRLRPQGDIDFLLTPEDAPRARAAAVRLGY